MTIEQELIRASLLNPDTLITGQIDLDYEGEDHKDYEANIVIPNCELTIYFSVYFRTWGIYSDDPQNDSSDYEPILEELEVYFMGMHDDDEELQLTQEQKEQVFNLIIK